MGDRLGRVERGLDWGDGDPVPLNSRSALTEREAAIGTRNANGQRGAYPSPGIRLRTAVGDIGWKSDFGATRYVLTRVRLFQGEAA